jgi:hypothetical protein
VLAVAVAASLGAGTGSAPAAETSAPLGPKIQKARKTTWHWQRVMQRPRTPVRGTAARQKESIEYQQWVLRVWRSRAARAYRVSHDPPHERQFRCIHRHEGGWEADTGNGYYGGLQMDIAFQRAYGRRLLRTKGTADNWTPFEQIWVGERALRAGRGYHPWPVAARRCGLL